MRLRRVRHFPLVLGFDEACHVRGLPGLAKRKSHQGALGLSVREPQEDSGLSSRPGAWPACSPVSAAAALPARTGWPSSTGSARRARVGTTAAWALALELRTREAERAPSRSPVTRWTSSVGAPRSALLAEQSNGPRLARAVVRAARQSATTRARRTALAIVQTSCALQSVAAAPAIRALVREGASRRTTARGQHGREAIVRTV